MSRRLRQITDKSFTGLSLLSVLFLAAALVVILGPLLWRGSGAVFFDSTVEWRERQFEKLNRGDPEEMRTELARAEQARAPVYRILHEFRRGISPEHLEDEARSAYRDFGDALEATLTYSEYGDLKRAMRKKVRKKLEAAFLSDDAETARSLIREALAEEEGILRRVRELLPEGTEGRQAALAHGSHLFEMGRDYLQVLDEVSLADREKYAEALADVQEAITELFGPAPGEPKPELEMDQYGVPHMYMARDQIHRILYDIQYVSKPGQVKQVKVDVPRAEQFAGTRMIQLLEMFEDEQRVEAMLQPEFTIYWQYFTDDSTPGHYFGGVLPEIIGTGVMVVLAVVFAFPVGVISAAYLVEVAGENKAVRFIRMCVNTLAGVPSIIFGLFGLAFFVGYVTGRPSVLACSLTLAVLSLPVIIRASEEAIRAVPTSYKEAGLALGASRLRCFLTVQLPAALPGILTGVILALGRAAGETAPILFVGAVATGGMLPVFGESPLGWLGLRSRALSYGAYDMAVNDRISEMVPHQQWGMAATLLVLVLLLNITAIALRWRISKKLRG